MDTLDLLPTLVGLSLALGADQFGVMVDEERTLVDAADGGSVAPKVVSAMRDAIRAGRDPLGELYCAIRTPEERRPLGQTYTPPAIVQAMVRWAGEQEARPARVVDPGAGSGRYLLSAGKAFPDATLHGTDIDPLATLMLRANLFTAGLADRSHVHLGDYRALVLPAIPEPTLFLGNPPYVRHHLIEPRWKAWLASTARKHGLEASALAGLHVHFFLATAEHGRPGDLGSFITSAEWLDVNYGSLVRELLLGKLGGESLHVLDPESTPFTDATTTGAITCFRIGTQPSHMKVRRVADVGKLAKLATGRKVTRQRLTESSRWSVLTRVTPKLPSGFVELGELCRVHRGTVTGANNVWVQRGGDIALPAEVLVPSVTKARELFAAGEALTDDSSLRRVIDLPVDLDAFNDHERAQIDKFLSAARKHGVHEGYVAANRRAWWSVGLRDAAPILATYMARRPPAFVRNVASARHINIAHGIYPRETLRDGLLDALASHLRSSVTLSQGRTYAGGLVKFEPREMERIPVPSIDMLAQGASE